MKFEYAQGATPLNIDEIDGLLPLHITTQGQLNEWEALNILEAENWIFSTSYHEDFLTIDFVKLLHKKMFENTWKWAGVLRKTEKNIGVSCPRITTDLKNLLDDVRYQSKNNIFSIDEIAYRFHHRLVWIHPFANGNGRHARMITDIFLVRAGQPRFTWGSEKLEVENTMRKQYINALRTADKHDYAALAEFVRS